MNKPIAIICGTMAATGLWLLGAFIYYGMVYGHGNFEAGNFHRCRYWSEMNAATGRIEKHWERKWELTESTGDSSLLYDIELWLVSIVLLFLSVGIWVGEWATRREHDSRIL